MSNDFRDQSKMHDIVFISITEPNLFKLNIEWSAIVVSIFHFVYTWTKQAFNLSYYLFCIASWYIDLRLDTGW